MKAMMRVRLRQARRALGHGIVVVLRWVLTFHGRPRDIALGAAIGVVIAFTPTVGFQMVIAAFLATLVGASRAAAIVPVWITNPFTFVPVYGFTYMLGGWFWPGRLRGDVRQRLREVMTRMDGYDFWDMAERFRLLVGVGWDVFIPMLIGGLIVGFLLAGPTYLATLWIVNHARAFLPHRHHAPDPDSTAQNRPKASQQNPNPPR